MILGGERLGKSAKQKRLTWHPEFIHLSYFVVEQKMWATYNVTALVQIGLSVGITSPGDCLHG
jgi:hypothetical protein